MFGICLSNIDSGIKIIMIFVTKTKIMALSNPYLVLLQHADPDRKKNSVFT